MVTAGFAAAPSTESSRNSRRAPVVAGERPLLRCEVWHGAALEVELDPSNDVGRGDHVEAAGQVADHIHAYALGTIRVGAVAKGPDSATSSAAVSQQMRAPLVWMVLMMRIGLPLRGLAPAGDDDARPVSRTAFTSTAAARCISRLTIVRTPCAWYMKPDELAQVGPAAQIDHAAQCWMGVMSLADMHEQDAAAKRVDDLLRAARGPTTSP